MPKQTSKEKVEVLRSIIGPDIHLGLIAVGDLLNSVMQNEHRCEECRQKAHNALESVKKALESCPPGTEGEDEQHSLPPPITV